MVRNNYKLSSLHLTFLKILQCSYLSVHTHLGIISDKPQAQVYCFHYIKISPVNAPANQHCWKCEKIKSIPIFRAQYLILFAFHSAAEDQFAFTHFVIKRSSEPPAVLTGCGQPT